MLSLALKLTLRGRIRRSSGESHFHLCHTQLFPGDPQCFSPYPLCCPVQRTDVTYTEAPTGKVEQVVV